MSKGLKNTFAARTASMTKHDVAIESDLDALAALAAQGPDDDGNNFRFSVVNEAVARAYLTPELGDASPDYKSVIVVTYGPVEGVYDVPALMLGAIDPDLLKGKSPKEKAQALYLAGNTQALIGIMRADAVNIVTELNREKGTIVTGDLAQKASDVFGFKWSQVFFRMPNEQGQVHERALDYFIRSFVKDGDAKSDYLKVLSTVKEAIFEDRSDRIVAPSRSPGWVN